MNRILLYNGIYSFTAESFTEKLIELGNEQDLEVWINSPGGSVFAGWSMIAALKERSGKNNAKVMGNASSMAFYLLLFMDKVEALDVSTFIIHRADGYVENDEDRAFLDQVNKDLRAKFETRINPETFKDVTGVTFDEVFATDKRKDVVLTAKQAKKIGLVDKIVRLEPREIEAITNEFMAFSNLSQGSDEAQGSVTTEPKSNINNQKKQITMNLAELKANHADLVLQIIAEERDRVEAILAFAHLDLDACKSMISEGKNPSQKFYAEMTLKGISTSQLQSAKEDSPETVTPTAESPKAEENDVELKTLEAEAMAVLGLGGTE